VGGEAADGLEGIGVAEFGGAEEHDLGFVKGDGGDGVRERTVLTEVGSDSHHKEPFWVLVVIGKVCVVKDGIAVVK
jgi:hypothetical protein